VPSAEPRESPTATTVPAVSIVIPCHNAGPWLAEQLEALARQRFDRPWEIVLVDNRSTDDSLSVARRYADRFPAFRIIAADEGRSPAYARNVGVRAAQGEIILFCDADDVVADNWLATMAGLVEKHRFVACRLEQERLNPPETVSSRHFVQDHELIHHPFYDHAGAGTIGVRRTDFLKAGGFDERLKTHEDLEFCWRMQLDGFTLHFTEETWIHYRYRAHATAAFRQQVRYGRDYITVYRMYRSLGHEIPMKRLRGYVREFLACFLHGIRNLHDKQARLSWINDAGFHLGMILGLLGRPLHPAFPVGHHLAADGEAPPPATRENDTPTPTEA